MKIAVIGASAGVGLEVVKQLIAAGDSVTTLSRRIDSIPDSPQVTKVQGSALNETDVRRTIEGADAVLVTLGTGLSTKATGLYPNASQALLKVLANSPNKPPVINRVRRRKQLGLQLTIDEVDVQSALEGGLRRKDSNGAADFRWLPKFDVCPPWTANKRRSHREISGYHGSGQIDQNW